jgi:hypothetical protein
VLGTTRGFLLLLCGAVTIAAPLAPLACGSPDARSGFDPADDSAPAPPSEGGGPGFGDGGLGACQPDPDAFDIPGNGCDDDGDGAIDNVRTCDEGLGVFGDAAAFARAIGLCQGVVSATFTRGHASVEPPADGQHGVLPAFGKVIRAREGANLGVLSTGWARAYDDLSATSCDPATLTHCFKQGVQMQGGVPTLGAAPPGFPKSVAGCSVSDQLFDAISLKVDVRVPKNVQGFSLDFDFFSGEWPDYVCTKYNDGFVLLVDGQNVAYDAQGNPLSVNNAFFDRCTVGTQTGCRGEPPIFGVSSCGGDLSELEETGFHVPGLYCNAQLSAGGGATGWLTTQSPASPGGTLHLELVIWDSGDSKFDSTVLVDHFQWVPIVSAPSTSRLR